LLKLLILFRYFGAIATALLAILAFPPDGKGIIAWIAFLPLLIATAEKPRDSAIQWYFAGFLFYLIGFFWLTPVTGIWYILLSFYLAFFWALFGYSISSFPSLLHRIVLGTMVWFSLEIIQTHLFTGIPWFPLGLSQWRTFPIHQLGSIIGVKGISALLIAVNLSLATMAQWKKKYLPILFIGGIWGFAFIYSGTQKIPDSTDFEICAVQGNEGQWGRDPYESFDTYLALSKNISKKTDLILWPESSVPLNFATHTEIRKILMTALPSPILLGTMLIEEDKMYNVSAFIRHQKVQYHKKIHLVPYGEFLPGKGYAVIRRLYQYITTIIPETAPGKEYTLFSLNGRKFASLICFENIFPELSTAYAKLGAEFFVVLTNDSWYGDSPGPRQHFAHNLFRAIETGRYVIQSSTSGITGIATPNGDILLFEKNGKKMEIAGLFYTSILPLTIKTPYTVFGDLSLFILLLFLTGGMLCTKQKH
jgi:apolipoprotein N-acyltransferase